MKNLLRSSVAKRVLSAGLVVVLVIAMIQVIPMNTVMDVTFASEEGGSGEVIRRPIENLGELPQSQYGVDGYYHLSRGTAERPFFILEIVPYEEFAEFGYLIGGCEPINLDKLEAEDPAELERVSSTLQTMNTCDLYSFNGNMYYFSDEPEYVENNGKEGNWEYNGDDSFYGYYELVPAGEGTFIYTTRTVTSGDAGSVTGNDIVTVTEPTIQLAEDGNGNLVWHTINEFNLYYHQYQSDQMNLAKYLGLYEGVEFKDISTAIKETPLVNIGDRIYTKRTLKDYTVTKGNEYHWYEEPVFSCLIVGNQKYCDYQNKELFLRNSVLPGAGDNQINNFSVMIKTITPAELNQQPEWIDYADLISMAPKMHAGESAYVELWKQHNYFEKEYTAKNYQHNFEGERDLSWQCAMKIYQKCTADVNYAALVMDDNAFQSPPSPSTDVTIQVHNWNLEKNKTNATYNHNGSANNYYKLYSMLLCMDPYFFKQIYLDGYENGTALIYDDNGVGKLRLQEGAAAEYWCLETFLLAPDDRYVNLYDYWFSKDMWETYGYATCSRSTTNKGWCKGHVYIYDGSNSLAQGYVSMNTLTNLENFPDFTASLTGDDKPRTAEAIQYILGMRANPNDPTYGRELTLKILDLEPSTDLYEDGTPNYYLKPSYVSMLLPNFRGKVQIAHQTTAEFIGKIEDLNTTYNMIYMGLDYSAYNTRNIDGVELPDWNDDRLDGKIYLHTGDKMISAEYNNIPGRPDVAKNRSAKWLLRNNSDGDELEIRFPGNDISLVKKDDLTNFLKTGYPIVVDAFLYNLDPTRIENPSNIYSFISENREYANLFSTANTSNYIEDRVKATLRSNVQFTELPKKYNGSTGSEDSPVVTNPNYLDTRYLNFKFNLTPSGNEKYNFRIYTDQDRNSKFSPDEVVYTNVANTGSNAYDYRISASWVGMVSWKIEVYEVDANGNETGVRYAETGRSAVRNTGEKKQINVLQIMPMKADGYLDLSNNPLFTKYYTQLQDYKITVTSITWDDFASYFFYEQDNETKVTRGFYYDYTKSIDEVSNPVNLDKLGGNLDDYNMIIVGFGDSYHPVEPTNVSNEFGAIDYLRYYVDQGKSILFTHDLTSMYNVKKDDFGYTMNALMRDYMGMNRYQAVSNQLDKEQNLNTVWQESNPNKEYEMLSTYQAANKYDWLNSSAKHGYTYVALKRVGYGGAKDQYTGGGKVPYKYMIVNPQGNYVNDNGEDIENNFKFGKETGFNNGSDVTTKVTMANEGQVTTYPYLIGGELTVSPTHSQWYSLNPEDEDVTVWYTLAGDPKNMFDVNGGGANGTSLSYAVSPNDAMNNYYIYSKGNIFYSGVGHSLVDGDMEAKLFINTMIAAYNASHEPPVIEVTNPEATVTGTKSYSIELLQNYDYGVDAEGNFTQTIETFGESAVYPVNFVPLDTNLISAQFECTIFYDNGDGNKIYVDEVVELKNENGDPVLNADGTPKTLKANASTHVFTNLENGKNYRLYYPKKYLANSVHDVYFTIKDTRNTESTTILHMDTLPLFPLD